MGPPRDDDAAAFVLARWPDLEPVALVATLDAPAARALTADAFGSVVRSWRSVSASPTAAARRALLERVHRAGADLPAAGTLPGAATAGTAEDVVGPALADALVGERPLVRAALAAATRWDLPGDAVLALAPGVLDAGDLAAAHGRMRRAHRAARAVEGLAPADDLLEPDLHRLLDRAAAAHPPPADPWSLVVAGAPDRRRVLLGVGLGAAVALAVGSALGRQGAGGDTGDEGAASDGSGTDWSAVRGWAARGALAGEPGVAALVARTEPAAWLVLADDVDGLRVVVAALPGSDPRRTGVRVWTGPAGTPPDRLAPLDHTDDTVGSATVLGLGVPHPGGALLLVLAAPRVRRAAFSAVVRPTRAGSVERVFRPVPLVGGVGSWVAERPWGVAGRLRVDGFDGAPARPRGWGPDSPVTTGAGLEGLTALVSSATGEATRDLTGRVVVDSVVDGSVLDPGAVSPLGADGRVLLHTVTTARGGVVRGLRVTDDGRSASGTLVTPPVVLPARQADAPVVVRLGDLQPRTGRFLVVVPGGGRTCQLLATSPNAYPVSKVVRLRGESAVVPVVNADDASGFRLVVTDGTGRRTYDGVPPAGRPLLAGPREPASVVTLDDGGTSTTRGPDG